MLGVVSGAGADGFRRAEGRQRRLSDILGAWLPRMPTELGVAARAFSSSSLLPLRPVLRACAGRCGRAALGAALMPARSDCWLCGWRLRAAHASPQLRLRPARSRLMPIPITLRMRLRFGVVGGRHCWSSRMATRAAARVGVAVACGLRRGHRGISCRASVRISYSRALVAAILLLLATARAHGRWSGTVGHVTRVRRGARRAGHLDCCRSPAARR